MKPTKPFALLVCAVVLAFTRPLITSAVTTWQVVVSGLDNPRGLAFGPEGALYIAQAGSGGDGPEKMVRSTSRTTASSVAQVK